MSFDLDSVYASMRGAKNEQLKTSNSVVEYPSEFYIDDGYINFAWGKQHHGRLIRLSDGLISVYNNPFINDVQYENVLELWSYETNTIKQSQDLNASRLSHLRYLVKGIWDSPKFNKSSFSIGNESRDAGTTYTEIKGTDKSGYVIGEKIILRHEGDQTRINRHPNAKEILNLLFDIKK